MGQFGFGQSVRRREDPRLLTGGGRFIDDQSLPGQAHAVVLRSPHAHAAIRAIDTAAAAALPGILGIFTGADLAADGIGGIPCDYQFPPFPGAALAPPGIVRPHFGALALDRVRFVGDGVALVVATSTAAARDAAELVEVDYDILPAVTATDRATDPDAARVWDAAPGNVAFVWEAGNGDAVEAAFPGAARICRVELVNNRVVIGAIETRGAIGSWDAGSDRFTLHAATQMPHGVRGELAQAMGVGEDRIRVLVGDVGGGFGAKNALYPEHILVLWAARRLGRPVKWLAERSESFLADYMGRDNVTRGELALDGEGRFLALRVSSTCNLGAYLSPKGPLSPTVNVQALAGVYRTPAIHVRVTGVFTHTAPTDVYRGAGRPEAIHLLERLVDAAAREIGIDPVTLRRRNLVTPADLPFPTPLGLVYDSGEFGPLLDEALALAGWAQFPQRRAEAARRGRLRGLGFAHYCERVAGGWHESAEIEIDRDGIATAYLATMSNGQGHATAYAQLVADRLGIDIDRVRIVQGDTDRIAPGHGTGGSSSLAIAGAALDFAVTKVVARARALAAELLETAIADIEFAEGVFTVVGTDRRITLAAVAAAAHDPAQLPPGAAPGLADTAEFRPPAPTFPNGCHLCEVEIDPETGKLAILAYRMVHDFGRVLNPMLLEAQLHGGVAQGLGQAAFEHVVYDPESGQLLSGSLMDYCLPRADDLPSFDFATRPTAAPSNPLGVKGCGEAGCAGAPPALMNAILDALHPVGVRHIDMPATAERIWRAIREAEAA